MSMLRSPRCNIWPPNAYDAVRLCQIAWRGADERQHPRVARSRQAASLQARRSRIRATGYPARRNTRRSHIIGKAFGGISRFLKPSLGERAGTRACESAENQKGSTGDPDRTAVHLHRTTLNQRGPRARRSSVEETFGRASTPFTIRGLLQGVEALLANYRNPAPAIVKQR